MSLCHFLVYKCYISLKQRNWSILSPTWLAENSNSIMLGAWGGLAYHPEVHSRISWYLGCHNLRSPYQLLHLLWHQFFKAQVRQCVPGRPETSLMVVHSSTIHRVSESPRSLGVSVEPPRGLLLSMSMRGSPSPRPFQKHSWFLCTYPTPSLWEPNHFPQ